MMKNMEPTMEQLMELENEIEFDEEVIEVDEKSRKTDSTSLLLADIGSIPRPDEAEERRLWEMMAEGGKARCEARERLIKGNLRLLVYYAKGFVKGREELCELVSMGLEGLEKAVDKFDYRLGYKFSTYACWWIKQSIKRKLNSEASLIRKPSGVNGDILKINRVIENIKKEYNYIPSAEEIADYTKLSVKKVEELMKTCDADRLVYIDEAVGDEGDSTRIDYIPDGTFDPSTIAEGKALENSVKNVLDKLTDREARVLTLRYGLDNNEPMTLESIAKLPEFGMTKERVRQIEVKALRKIRRTPSMSRELADYYCK